MKHHTPSPPDPEQNTLPHGGRSSRDAVLASFIDHTLLQPGATPADAEQLCTEALTYGFCSVCVFPALLPTVAKHLAGASVIPCTVAGFPHGASLTSTKAAEAATAAAGGAREIDMVIAVWALKSRQYQTVATDIREVVNAASPGCSVKVILETCLLTDDEKILVCKLAMDNGAAFVKTSTGLSTGGATVHDVALMRRTVGTAMGVKASGGIRTTRDALSMIEAGASRIGTSSGIQIITGDPSPTPKPLNP